MVVDVDIATTRLGLPKSTVERGTISNDGLCYIRKWNWPCGCAGEIIAGTLIELHSCELHER
jgi:hypothetical protein